MIYSWQLLQWQQIMQRGRRMPHALLLRGRAGLGKEVFAHCLSQALLCQQVREQQACGLCQSCVWFKEGHHPDFRHITPEDESAEEGVKKKTTKKTQISVAQIRQLTQYLSLTNHQVYGRRIVLITPADALNTASANALLKMLEEPPENTLFLLVSSQAQRLLPTIVSRCQIIDMPIPEKSQALAWLTAQGVQSAEDKLDYAGGAPLLALQMQAEAEAHLALIKQLAQGAHFDALAQAPLFLSVGMTQALDLLQKWVFDLLNYKLAHTVHYHRQHASALQALSKSVNLGLLMRFMQQLTAAKKTATHPLNNEMQLENILLAYSHIFDLS